MGAPDSRGRCDWLSGLVIWSSMVFTTSSADPTWLTRYGKRVGLNLKEKWNEGEWSHLDLGWSQLYSTHFRSLYSRFTMDSWRGWKDMKYNSCGSSVIQGFEFVLAHAEQLVWVLTSGFGLICTYYPSPFSFWLPFTAPHPVPAPCLLAEGQTKAGSLGRYMETD